jgi:hypothetical protein
MTSQDARTSNLEKGETSGSTPPAPDGARDSSLDTRDDLLAQEDKNIALVRKMHLVNNVGILCGW